MNPVHVVPTSFESEGETLQGNFVLPDGDGPFYGICKFHGLPGGPDQIGGIARTLAENGFAVLTFDFRGFRRSEGLFSLAGEIMDARSAIDHLLSSSFVVKDWVGVYGASFGGAIAVCTAARNRQVKALCLRAPVYDTLYFAQGSRFRLMPEHVFAEMASSFRGIDNPAIRKLILDKLVSDAEKYNPMYDIRDVSCPLFVTTGDQDEVIDVAGVKRLFEAAREPKEFILIEGANHRLDDILQRRCTFQAIVAWFLKQTRQC